MARKETQPIHKVKMTEGKRNIIRQLLQEYEIESAEDIQNALKDLLGGTIKELMEAEMDAHLGYRKSERSDTEDYRNGYKPKQVHTSYGSISIDVPQDRQPSFAPKPSVKGKKIFLPSTKRSSVCMPKDWTALLTGSIYRLRKSGTMRC